MTYASPNLTLTEYSAEVTAGEWLFHCEDSTGANGDAPSTLRLTPAPDAFPTSIPMVTNFSTLDGMDPSQPLTLRWNALEGGVYLSGEESSLMSLIVRDTARGSLVFETGLLPVYPPGVLIELPRHAELPANLLSPRTAYTIELAFANRVRGVLNAGVLGCFGSACRPGTNYELRTQADFVTGGVTTPIPEPSSAVLGVVAAILLVRRRGEPEQESCR